MNKDMQKSSFQRVAFSVRPELRSFTLIELMVVMVVIVILAGISFKISQYVGARADAARSEAELQKIRGALEEYRAVYGEYPVLNDPRHYGAPRASRADEAAILGVSFEKGGPVPLNFETAQNVPVEMRLINLVTIQTNISQTNIYGVEYMPFGDRKRFVDARLTYPLKVRPKLEGREPFIDFPEQTVAYLVWRKEEDGGYKVATNIDVSGAKRLYLQGNPVNRVVAIDPATMLQWYYESTDGVSYILTSEPLVRTNESGKAYTNEPIAL